MEFLFPSERLIMFFINQTKKANDGIEIIKINIQTIMEIDSSATFLDKGLKTPMEDVTIIIKIPVIISLVLSRNSLAISFILLNP
jgi:hypothetical protein